MIELETLARKIEINVQSAFQSLTEDGGVHAGLRAKRRNRVTQQDLDDATEALAHATFDFSQLRRRLAPTPPASAGAKERRE